MKKYHFLFLFFACVNLLFSQGPTFSGIRFSTVWGTEKFELYKKYILKEDTISVSMLKFYISDIVLKKKNTIIYKTEGKSYLMNPEKKLEIDFDQNIAEEADEIDFSVGVDSTTNVSGALGGDLDPMNGMYWSWQSGYVNFKIEGTYGGSAAQKDFQFHIGGYSSLFPTLQAIALPLGKNQKIIYVDILRFLLQIDLNKIHSIMSPGEKAVILARQFGKVFYTDRK